MAGSVFADTVVLENPNFEGGTDPWLAGSNSFIGGIWQAYISDGYTVADRVTSEGENFVYTSWDDGASDTLENFLIQEWGAGPAGSPTAAEFSAGDVFVFKGMASATRTGNTTGDMKVRAFIKMLGYTNNLAFQIKDDYTEFHDIGADMEPFELTVTFPDLEADDSFQVIQMGFEITTNYDSGSETMDSGEIIFSGLEGIILGEGGGDTWNGYEVDENGWVDTDTWLGWLNVTDDPWVLSLSVDGWIYVPVDQNIDNGGWVYFQR